MSQIVAARTPLAGLFEIDRKPHVDARGSFARLFCDDALSPWGWDRPIRQINHSTTEGRGTLRGMHFQFPPDSETKLVTCLAGEVFDVAVDLRAGSPTFLRWHGVMLSSENRRSLLIPRGFAHGFQTLTEHVELLYLHDAAYAPRSEGGLCPLDPRLAIAWPLPVSLISDRDAKHPLIDEQFRGIPS
jgi:dTDP-4-dehydrorhamnose 3,5-epimerase